MTPDDVVVIVSLMTSFFIVTMVILIIDVIKYKIKTDEMERNVTKLNEKIRLLTNEMDDFRFTLATLPRIAGPQGPTGPTGMMGLKGDDGISKEQKRVVIAWITTISLRARDLITNDQYENITELIDSPDRENLIVAEELIKNLNIKANSSERIVYD